MGKIAIVGEPDISLKEIPNEGEYYEIEWTLNERPTGEWDTEFEKMIKPLLEKEGTLLGLYKPKIINNILISTLKYKDSVTDQRKFFEDTFFNKINAKLYK